MAPQLESKKGEKLQFGGIKNKDVNMLIIPNRTQKGGTKMGSVDVVKYFRCTNWNRKDKPCHFRQRVVVLRSVMDIPGEKLA